MNLKTLAIVRDIGARTSLTLTVFVAGTSWDRITGVRTTSLSVGLMVSGGAFRFAVSLTGATTAVRGLYHCLLLTARRCHGRLLAALSIMPESRVSVMATTPEHGMRGEREHRQDAGSQ